ncbi:MAG: hypothetical protein J5691_00990 [Bacilli bacterium]|nr:hypothetical protein [Bacilli bacterium]
MKITDETLESLAKQLAELEPDRQHGRKGIALADSEAEKRRLYNNLASRLSRARKKNMLKEKEKTLLNKEDEDEFGITAKDIRRYKGCYVYENILPDREYIKRMTGLDDIQVAELDRRVRENILKV